MLRKNGIDLVHKHEIFDDRPAVCPACGTGKTSKLSGDRNQIFLCGAGFTTEREEYHENKPPGWYWYSQCIVGQYAAAELREQLNDLLDIAEQALTGVNMETRETIAFAPMSVLASLLWHTYGRGRSPASSDPEVETPSYCPDCRGLLDKGDHTDCIPF